MTTYTAQLALPGLAETITEDGAQLTIFDVLADLDAEAATVAIPEWVAACADVKGTHLTAGHLAATELAASYLEHKTITPGDYIALVRWSEGRASYVANLFTAAA